MRTFGLCIKSDGICARINHPLNYYRLKKKKEKKDPTPPSD
jgi:DNA primase large subunit